MSDPNKLQNYSPSLFCHLWYNVNNIMTKYFIVYETTSFDGSLDHLSCPSVFSTKGGQVTKPNIAVRITCVQLTSYVYGVLINNTIFSQYVYVKIIFYTFWPYLDIKHFGQ